LYEKQEQRNSFETNGIANDLQLISEEESTEDIMRYDPKDDFTIVKSRFVDLDRLYWLEDRIVCQRFEYYDKSIDNAFKDRTRAMESFEHQMVQMKNLFSNKPDEQMTPLSGGDMSSQDSYHSDTEIIHEGDAKETTQSKLNNNKQLKNEDQNREEDGSDKEQNGKLEVNQTFHKEELREKEEEEEEKT